MDNITVVITTINRPTLLSAIRSCGNHPVVVVSDGQPVDTLHFPANVTYICLGQKHGNYGCAAFNVGCALAKTAYITKLDDDDEFIDGALEKMESIVVANPEIDIWIPGLLMNDGTQLCMSPGELRVQNVACPTIKTKFAVEYPIFVLGRADIIDYYHIAFMNSRGLSISWYNEPLIAVRPRLAGWNGAGQ